MRVGIFCSLMSRKTLKKNNKRMYEFAIMKTKVILLPC